jgi:hypothetical protein
MNARHKAKGKLHHNGNLLRQLAAKGRRHRMMVYFVVVLVSALLVGGIVTSSTRASRRSGGEAGRGAGTQFPLSAETEQGRQSVASVDGRFEVSGFQAKYVSRGARFDPTTSALAPTTVTVNAGPDVDAANNDYKRIQNAIDTAADGDTIILNGTFDFTTPFAAAAWAFGHDNTPSGDDYEVLVPAGKNNIILTANALGDATIQGPGDLAGVDLEGFLVFDGGPNQGWTISNLRILDFDLSIGMFNGAGGVDAFSNTTIQNNLIRIPNDLNATVAPADLQQNIGIHFSYGTNQSILNNTIDIPGDGINDLSNTSWSVGMQSNSSGGNVYDGLKISGNAIHVLNAQSANPQRTQGIWEDGFAHASNITVSNNSFINDAAGNDPTLNKQSAFRVTSHSSATTLVKYDSNTVNGANIGFEWLNGANFAGNEAVVLTGNTITNSNTGVLVRSDGIAHFENNVITGSGSGAGIHVVTGTLTGSGANANSVYQNSVTGGSGDGIWIEATAGAVAPISNNDLSGNGSIGLRNESAPSILAERNWWGSNLAASVTAKVSGNADFDPWLASGTDVSPSFAFQPFNYATTSGTMTTFLGTAAADTGSLLAGDPVTMTMNGETATTPLAQLLNFDVQLGGSDDIFTLGQTGIPTTFDGGAGNDTLAGTNVAQNWNITGAGSGNIPGATSSFSGVEALRGGTASDSFVFGASGSIAQTIDGNLGADTLNNYAIPGATFTPTGAGTLDQFKGTATGLGAGFDNINLPTPNVSGTKDVKGNFAPNGSVTYTVVLSNTGAGPQSDNPGDEFTDVLPSDLSLVSASATSGTATPNVGTNTVNWNGSIAAGGSVTITINATVKSSASGASISNQGSISYDADADGTNESSRLTDDPNVGGASDPTSFTVCTYNALVVTTTADSGAGSLREQIAIAGPCSTITFSIPTSDPGYDPATGVYTISLTSGELIVNKNVTITGPGQASLTIDGNLNSGVFVVDANTVVEISGLTVANGKSNIGGGILNLGRLTLSNLIVTKSRGKFYGGGVMNFFGTLALSGVTFSHNRSNIGGGLYNLGDLTITKSTFSANHAVGPGAEGGGIDSEDGTLTIVNSTISGNTSDYSGGGLLNCGNTKAILTNVTITDNHAGGTAPSVGGGISQVSSDSITLNNTIVAGNFLDTLPFVTPDDIGGNFDSSSSYNLIGVDSGCSNLINGNNGNQVGTSSSPINASLGKLRNNGGPTESHLLLPGSPAIDAGNNALIALPVDQRGGGFPRLVNTKVDIGAVEVSYGISASAGTPQSSQINSVFTTALRALVTESGNPVRGIVVTFTAPGSGPGVATGTFQGGGSTAFDTTNANGVAVAPVFTANGIANDPLTYQVIASAVNISSTASFSLTNTKGLAQVTLSNLVQTFDDNQKAVTVMTVPAPLAVDVIYNPTPPKAPGTYSVAATVNDSNYTGQASGTLTINKAGQTITFAPLTGKTYGDADFSVSATTAPSTPAVTPPFGPVSFSATGQCNVTGSLVHITAAGSCTITASHGGDTNYNAALNVVQTLAIDRASQTITFTKPADKTYGDAPFNLSGSASSGLGVSFQILSGPATVSGNTVTLTGPGAVTVRAAQSGDSNYKAAADVDQTFLVAKAPTTTTVTSSAGSPIYGQSVNYTAAVTSNAGTPAGSVQFKDNGTNVGAAVALNGSGTASFTSSTLTAGGHSITADYSGAANFIASTGTLNIVIIKATPVITWNNPSDIIFGTALSSTELNATADTLGTFTYTPSSGTQLNAGANQQLTASFTPSDTTNYNTAGKSVVISVLKANQTITFGALANKTFGDPPFTVSASSNSGLNITFRIVSGPATISGNTIILTGAGTLIVRASQVGNANYNAAPNVDQTFTVNCADTVVTNGGDSGAGSLRDVISKACAGSTITFNIPTSDPGYDSATGIFKVTLTSGELLINENLTIQGTGANVLTVMRSKAVGTPDFRIFNVASGNTFNLSGLTVSNGKGGNGGGLLNTGGTVNVNNSVFTSNSAPNRSGGGITNDGGTLIVSNSNISAGIAVQGGGIFNANNGTVTLINSTVSGNTAANSNGGFGAGGGIFNASGVTTLTNVTVSNNFTNATGGGIVILSGAMNLRNTIVAGNFQGTSPNLTADDISGTVDPSSSFNLIGTGGAGGLTNNVNNNQVGVINPGLAPMSNYGGPTPTLALLPGSPAIDSGTSAGATSQDQRGVSRVGAVDIGAFESRGFTINVQSGNNQTTPINTAFAALAAKVTSGASEPVAGGQVTFTGPAKGAGAVLGGSGNNAALTLDNNGLATASATANGTTGSYSVLASAQGASSATFNLTNAKGSQTITFGALANRTYGDAPFSLSATSISGLPVSFQIVSGPATVSANTVTITGAGAVVVRASQSGDSNYNAATPVDQSFTVAKANQTITFGALANKTFGNSPFTVSASSTSGLTVTFSIASGPATISGNTVTITGAGTVVVRASQAGDNNYNSATPVDQSFTVAKANQTVTFGALANKTYGDPPFSAIATASSGLTVTFSIVSGPATVTGDTVTITGAGTIVARASQVGDGNYNAATPVDRTVTVAQAASTTTVASSQNPSEFGQSVSFTATVSSTVGTPTGTVQFKDGGTNLGSPVALSGGKASASFSNLSSGNHNITAVYSGDTNFLSSTGTLQNGQTVNGQVGVSVNDSSVTEGDTGTKGLTFTVTLSAASTQTVSVNYQTADGTATVSDNDYQAASGALTFNPGETNKTITVQVNGDVKFETDETFFVNLSNPVNSAVSDNQGTGTILNDDVQGGIIKFNATDYTVGEGDGQVVLTVTRTGDTSSAANVDYSSGDVTAKDHSDYSTAVGTLKFAAGETSKTITVLINEDSYVDPAEIFTVTLSNPTGGAQLGSPGTATVLINDDDTQQPTTNIIDDASAFVRQQYHDFLNREPDAGGLGYWTNEITKCGSDQACIRNRRIDVSAAFFMEQEFQQTGFYVYRVFKASNGRVPLYIEYMRGRNEVLGGPNLAQQQADYAVEQVNPAYTGKTNAEYVDQLYQNAGVTPSSPEKDALVNGLNNNTETRGSVLQKVANNQTFTANEKNAAFVLAEYFGYLRRDPEPAGFQFWLDVLNNKVPGNFRSMVCAFITSAEYQERFSSVVSHTNAECQ